MKPNILLIVTDQHRLDTLRYYNPKTPVHTPNLDALSAQSLCIANAYTTTPVCTPARASLHTGHFPSRLGMETNIYQPGCQTHEIPDTPVLLSRKLQNAGYVCGFTGKWHLGVGKDKNASKEGRELLTRRTEGYLGVDAYLDYGTLPSDVGFIGDDFPGHGNGGNETPLFQEYLASHNLEQVRINAYRGNRKGDHSKGALITSGEETTIERYLSLRTTQIIKELRTKDAPFFMALNFWGPHEPYYTLQEDYQRYEDLEILPWKSFTGSTEVESRIHKIVQRPEVDWEFFANNLRHYYGMITNIDRQIGHLLTFLEEEGLRDNTWIIFTADHGDSQGCHNGMENKSGHLYDETTKIPLMISPPTGLEGQRVSHSLASTVDIYATILDLAGYSKENFQSGHSLLSLFDGDLPIRDDVVCECISAFPLLCTQRMYRKDDWKYIFNGGAEDELYNLVDDPEEMHNLIDELPDRVEVMRNNLALAMERNGDPVQPWYCKMTQINDWRIS